MAPKDLVATYLFEAYNDADHATRLAEEARHALGAGDLSAAEDWLRQAQRPAGLVEMRFRAALRKVAELRLRIEGGKS